MKDDKFKYVLYSTDGRGEFVTLPRSFVQGCTMKPTQFEEMYNSFCTDSKNYTEAYHKAEDLHVKLFGEQKYSDFHSFSEIKNRKKRK